MKRCKLVWLGLATVVTIAGVALLPSVHWRLIGWARNEAFFQGRPTSYWKRDVRQWQMVDSWLSGDLYFFPPDFDAPVPTPAEEFLVKCLGVRHQKNGPVHPLDDAGSAGVPVLVELLSCEEKNVRLFAIQSLGHIGPGARAALGPIRQIRQTTEDYLVYRETGLALSYIDGTVPLGTRPDENQLWERYRANLGFKVDVQLLRGYGRFIG
jgi:hypothetical protein